ncbi:sulfatase-like hydrolase/transferase [uncultured Polaribacter sp.]|uniref:sulfatase-like hydrolase/transferase n=1 Tax=uncultured Polaribacter sp. TaxID=174711 RepID=UPI0026282A45|nr:sulfatase-like hydrolase/transferase [uncultured Polaribacter sp.]
MSRYFLVFLMSIGILFSCKSEKSNQEKSTEKPNVIVILVDDAGYIDFGFMGSKDLQTPHIDALAKSGVKFTDAHVSATVCAPSRAGLITGKYQQRFGFEANGTGGIGLSDDVTTIADVFKNNGYNTFALGKWHLGENESDHPNKRGFDEFYGFLSGSRSYFPLEKPSKEKMLQHNGKRIVFNGYMTDVLGDQSVKFIETSKDKPFFMYLSFNAVHTPMQAKQEDLDRFNNHPRKKLAAMTWSLDENVGKLLKKLDDLNKRNNTLIYFLSDNGGAHNNQSLTGPLKGWKGNKFEGGHRVPFILSWPIEISSNVSFDGLTSSLDIFSTSISAAKIKNQKRLQLDGVNLIPYLKGEKQGHPHHKLFWRKLDESAARVREYKIINLKGFGSVMYNLNKDLGETIDLSQTHSKKFDTILSVYKTWENQLINPLWIEEKPWMDVTWHIHKQLMNNKNPEYKDIWNPNFLNKYKK